jgi:MarR family transcriptional regulator, organic hydroperoxide resistance regulator
MPDRTTDGRRTALDQLARAAYRLSAADSRLRGRATRTPSALSLTHARALRVLAEQGPLTINQLATGTETTGPATTQLVNGLETTGYVTRERSPDDKRTVLVALTDAGAERTKERNAAMATALDEELSDQDLTALHTATEVLNRLCAIYDRL